MVCSRLLLFVVSSLYGGVWVSCCEVDIMCILFLCGCLCF